MNAANENLELFLKQCVLKKEDTRELTHTELTKTIKRRFHIPDDKYDTFMRLYLKDVIKKQASHNLIERQLTFKQEHPGSILLDIDFQHPGDCIQRQYDDRHIQDIFTITLKWLSNIFEMDEDTNFVIASLEKPTPRVVTKPNGTTITKDGIHLMFSVAVDQIYHSFIRSKIIEEIQSKEHWKDMNIINPDGWEDVFDTSISYGRNGWLPPMSRKPDDQHCYNVSRAYLVNYDVDQKRWNKTALVNDPSQAQSFYGLYYKHLFIRNKKLPKFALENTEATEYMNAFRAKNTKPNTVSSPITGQGNIPDTLSGGDENYQISVNTIRQIKSREEMNALYEIFLDNLPLNKYELKETIDYAMALPKSYYEGGTYNKWIKVGFALRNVSIYLLIGWIVFSAQSSTFDFLKHVPEICDLWTKFVHNPISGVTQLSLMYWAKTESPDTYKKIHENTVDFCIDLTIQTLTIDQLTAKGKSKGGSNDYDIATVVHKVMKGLFVSCGIKTNCWYAYHEPRWVRDDSGTTLRHILSTVIWCLYLNKATKLGEKAYQIKTPSGDVDVDNEEHILLKAKASMLLNVATRLKNTHDKDCIMRECRELFYEKDFEQKLDQNRYLLCFKNGVQDFKEKRFRKGYPEDYLSKCTNMEFRPFDKIKDVQIMEEIKDYLKKLFPIQEACDYVWKHLASILIGDTAKTQCLHYYTGGGSNGKSMLIKLLELILGEYATGLDVSFFVSDRPTRGKPTPELVNLISARLCITSEPTEGERLNEGPMKQLTSGTDKISYRGLYKEDQLSFVPQVHPIIMSNHYLPVTSRDHGTWRRIRVIKFESKFVDVPVYDDPDEPYQFKKEDSFDEKFNTWAGVFMAMLVEIAYEMQGSLPICDIIMKYSKEYQKKEDFITEYILDNLMAGGPNDRIKKTQVSTHFSAWYFEMFQSKQPGKTQELFSAIEKHFRVKYKGEYRGISIKRTVKEIEIPTNVDSDNDTDSASTSTVTQP